MDGSDARRARNRTAISGSPLSPVGNARRSRDPPRHCCSASAVPPSTVSNHSMRVCGLCGPKRFRQSNISQVGNRTSTATRSPLPTLPTLCAPRARARRRRRATSARAGRASVRRREYGLAPLDLEGAHLEHPLQLLHGIGHRGLALVQRVRCLRVAARFDDRRQAAPLFERNSRGQAWFSAQSGHSSIS